MTRHGNFYSGGKDSLHLESESLGPHIYEKLARVKGEDKMHNPININRSKLKEHEEELGKVAKALIEEGHDHFME